MIDPVDSELELSETEMQLYARQILLDGWDLEAQEKLKLSNVLIVGCGGIGCTAAELLTRAGVGKITLIDFDSIEISNLQRQTAFSTQDIGFYKAEILAKRLKQINVNIVIEYRIAKLDETNAEVMIGQQDLVLDGSDRFTTRYLVNQKCKQLNVPLISASAIGFQGQLFMIDGHSACYECLFPRGEQVDENLRCADTGVLATVPNVMASLQAHHALLYLGLSKTPLLQKLLLWDGLTMQQRLLAFNHDEDCPICLASQSAKVN